MAASKLKVGLVLDTSLDPTDGVQQYVTFLGGWLSGQGHEVHYLVGETHRTDLPNVHSLARNISVVFNGNRTTIPLYAKRSELKRFMENHDLDVLHVQTPHHPFLAQPIVLSAGPRTAVVGTFHVLPYGAAASFGNKLLGIWLKPSLKRFDRMMAVSDVAAQFCRKSFGVSAVTVPNMVDFKRFHAAKPFPRYNDGTLTILFLGRLVKRKGCQVLLEAVAKLNDKKLPKFRVVVCGRGELEKTLVQYAAANGLADKVEFAGFVSEADKPRYYASADLSVFPSSSGESFGIVLLEAMASGHAAVLAGDNPGYRSVMSGRPDLLFDPQNADLLARKIERYLTDTVVRRHAAEWAQKHAGEFDTGVVGQKVLGIYEEALRKRRNP